MGMSAETLGQHFQVTPANPLPTLAGRVRLLQRLGEVVAKNPDVFARADAPRPGGLFDHLVAGDDNRSIAAPRLLAEILRQLGPIWPGRLELAGVKTRG